MSETLAQADALLKEWYHQKRVESLTYAGIVLVEKMPKSTAFVGDVMPIPVKYSNPQGLSVAVGDAITAEGTAGANTAKTKYNLTVGDLNQVVSISDKLMMATRNDMGAFVQAVKFEIDSALENMRTAVGQYAYGGGGMSLGQRASAATDVITLTSKFDTAKFAVGMVIQASETDGTSGAVRAGSTYITAIDEDLGTITLNSAAAITGFANSDHLFRYGTHATSYSADIKGLGAWIPSAAPSATPFFGVVRTTDVVRLAGNRLLAADVNGLGIERRLKNAAVRVARQGTGEGITDFFMNPEQWQILSNAMEGRHIYAQDDGTGSTGHRALIIMTPTGPVRVWADRYCGINDCWGLRLSDWTLYTMGDFPRFIGMDGGDGNKLLRRATANDFEVRINCYPQFACSCPANQVYVPLETPAA